MSLVREEEEGRAMGRSLSTWRLKWTFRPSEALSSQEEMSIMTLEVLKDLRRGGQQFSLPAWCLVTLSGLLF